MKYQLPKEYNITKKEKKQFKKFAARARVIIKYFLWGVLAGIFVLIGLLIKELIREKIW